MLRIKITDLVRATLTKGSGNEGWIGVSPKGHEYHVVVPVDVQIARGVMACNRPTDGTPFGGYAGWLYFRCPPYDVVDGDDRDLREAKALETGTRLISWLASFQIPARLEADQANSRTRRGSAEEGQGCGLPSVAGTSLHESRVSGRGAITCPGCGKSWRALSKLINDVDTKFDTYRACSDDFHLGRYVFSHKCGTKVEIPVTRFARPKGGGRSLIGTHACPGLCYYTTSSRACFAACEGAVYRRIARRLRLSRGHGES